MICSNDCDNEMDGVVELVSSGSASNKLSFSAFAYCLQLYVIQLYFLSVISYNTYMACSKGEMENFLSSYSKNYSSYSQQATKTRTFSLLESGTDANSCSRNKVCECKVCKGM